MLKPYSIEVEPILPPLIYNPFVIVPPSFFILVAVPLLVNEVILPTLTTEPN